MPAPRYPGPVHRLIPHPDSAESAIEAMAVELTRPTPRQLILRYFMRGDMGAIRFPRARPPARRDELWEQTCFEAFLANPPGYLEFNFSPSTEWAAYRFDSWREGRRDAAIQAPQVQTFIGSDRFELRAELAMPVLGPVGLSAVIEQKDGAKSWWALAHPPGEPDFHHEACFALTLPEG